MQLQLDADTNIMNCVIVSLAEYARLPKPQYKSKVSELISELQATPKDNIPSQEVRIAIADLIAEAYFIEMGEYPSSYELEGLANYIMLDYIKSVHKSNTDINQFHSSKQTQRRSAREYLCDTTQGLFDFLYAKYDLCLDGLSKKNTMEVDE